MTDVKRQLVIKTNVVKRLAKEVELYEKERNQEQLRVEKLKADGADSYDIKHAVGRGPLTSVSTVLSADPVAEITISIAGRCAS